LPDSCHSIVPRSLRVAEEVQRILGEIFLTKVQLRGSGMLTVTHVECSRDLRVAKVYLSFLNPDISREEIFKELIRRRKEVRYHLGTELRAKYVPELRFYLDDSLEQSSRVNALLEKLHREGTAAKQ